MKKTLFYLIAIFVFAACGATQTVAEKEAKAQEINQAVEAFNFTFNATYAHPTGFRSIYLSPYYDVKVSPDTVQVYLPYYGRAYRAPMNPSEGGYKFTSTNFEYRIAPGKRVGNQLVEIKINDQHRELWFYFDIWENGSTRLNVRDMDRQPIAFQGEISVEDKEK